MISASSLKVDFGGRAIFDNISFQINKDDKVALIGKNGSGKSTLLKILSGNTPEYSKYIAVVKGTKIGYLSQDIDFTDTQSVFDEVYKSHSVLSSIQLRIEKIDEIIAITTDYESKEFYDLLDERADLESKFNILGGYQLKERVERILIGLGFSGEQFEKATALLSGGWRMRVELAKILVEEPDLILLDEPTNHLDIDSIEWLEDHLTNYPGAYVIVSHDKLFLDNTTDRTLELFQGKVYDYPFSYTQAIEYKNEIKAQAIAAKQNQEKSIRETEKFIEKFRAKASKARQVQSRVKQLEKIDIIQVPDEDVVLPDINFKSAIAPGKVIVSGEEVSKSFGTENLFNKINFSINRGEKVALIGKNGKGKSTLIKMIMNVENYLGKISLGHNVIPGYFAQNQADELNPEITVYNTIFDIVTGEMTSKVRNILGAFLFSEDDVFKKVKVLSGGERNRLALCKLIVEPSNFLLMDEPTNHLDMQSKEVLKNSLKNYDGTMLLVSHDRDFLSGLVDTIYEVSNQNIKEFHGDLHDYFEERKSIQLKEIQKQQNLQIAKEKTDYKDQKKVKNQLSKTEEQISELEKEIKELEAKIEKMNEFDEKLLKVYDSKKKELEEKVKFWEQLLVEADSLK